VILEEVEAEEEQEEQDLLGGRPKMTDEEPLAEMAEMGARTVVFGFGSGGEVRVGYVLFHISSFPYFDSLSLDSNMTHKCSEVCFSPRLSEVGSRHASVERSALQIHRCEASLSSLRWNSISSRLGRERDAMLWL
jgi:hypothetical protein